MSPIESKRSIVNVFIKIFCWLGFLAGAIVFGIGLAQFIISLLNINTEITKFNPETGFGDITAAANWAKGVSDLNKFATYNFGFILLGTIVMFLARIVSKPLLMGGNLFQWISEDNVEVKKELKKTIIIAFVFLSISLVFSILALAGVYQLLLSVPPTMNQSQAIIDNGIIAIEGLSASATSQEINFEVGLIITGLKESLNNFSPKLIIDRNLAMFILFLVGFVSWGIVEWIHGTVVRIERR